MKSIATLALLLAAAYAHADLFRCEVDGKSAYQDTPCSGGAKVRIIFKKPADPPPPVSRMSPNAANPSEDDRAAALRRARADVQRAKQLQEEQDREREHQRSLAFQDEQARVAEHNAKVERCQVAEIEVQRVESDAMAYKGDPWWRNKAVAEREKFRRMCW